MRVSISRLTKPFTNPYASFIELVTVAATSLLLLGMCLVVTPLMRYGSRYYNRKGDHLAYRSMAVKGVLHFHEAPYCWRVAVPFLAGLAPRPGAAFFAMTMFSLWATGLVLYLLVRSFGLSRTVALVGLLTFYSLGWLVRYQIFDFWLPDTESFLLVALAIYFIVRKHDLAYAATLLVGATVKESVLFTVPLYYTLNARRPIDLKLAGRMLLLAIPAVVALVAIRVAIPRQHGAYDYLERLEYYSRLRAQELSWQTVRTFTLGAFGLIPVVLALVGMRRNPGLMLRLLPFLLLVYGQLLLAHDTERLLVLGFPVIALMVGYGVDLLSRKLGISPIFFLALAAGNLVLNLSWDYFMPHLQDQIVLLVLAILLLVIVLSWRSFTRRSLTDDIGRSWG